MQPTINIEIIPSSFRDPSGFVFSQNNTIYRQINKVYRHDYEALMDSGLYNSLIDNNLLIEHTECDISITETLNCFKVIKPVNVPLISYPYEWCFSQLKDAALCTLRVQKKALKFNMSLKDCSAYNIQFFNGKPIFIDTLSFERYQEGKPWIAYKQFCQHFLAPLSLMAYKDVRLNQLLKIYIDGLPLDLTSELLPPMTKIKPSMLFHIHSHAKVQQKYSRAISLNDTKQVSRHGFAGLIDNLESSINKLACKRTVSEWGDYYQDTNYSETAFEHKKDLVSIFISKVAPQNVWDLGANIGIFSRIASDMGIPTISFDIDHNSVEANYVNSINLNEKNLLPLLVDINNPSPGIGWQNTERTSLLERGPTDLAIALALIHHLAISNNLPLEKIARFFASICKSLIIEFVPKEDSQVKRLLATRKDIFPDYGKSEFEKCFSLYFNKIEANSITDSHRSIYLFERNK